MRSEIAKEILARKYDVRDANHKVIKVGQVIKGYLQPRFEKYSEAPEYFIGRVDYIDYEKMKITVELPDGTKDIINWIEFIIYILPLLEKIVFIVRGWFTKKK